MTGERAVTTYGSAIREGFVHLLRNHPEVFVIGQGVWSPWYVGNSMTDLDIDFFDERYSSVEAEAALASLQFTKKKRKARIDQIAAQILLTAYLEAGARCQQSPEALDS